MDTMSTNYNRVRRSTAGINKRYDEQNYLLLSFPHLNKHSVVPATCIDVDPHDKQNGSIKTFGSRKSLRIVSSGSKEVMKERASRYAISADSEEVELVHDERENDEYSPSILHLSSKETKKRVAIGEQSKTQNEIISANGNDQRTTTSNHECFDGTTLPKKTPLSNRQLNFDRVYSSKTGTKRKHEDNFDGSSLSGSDVTDDEDRDMYIMDKSNELRSLLKKPRCKRKKRAVEIVNQVEEQCNGCKKLNEEIKQLHKRLDRLERLMPVIKKFRSKTPFTLTNQTNQIVGDNEIYTKIKEVTKMHPDQIKSTPTRPTMVMKELIRKSGYIGDKSYFKEHEELFKEFIQMKCVIPDNNMKAVWKEVIDSLSRQHIDEIHNRKRRVHKETPLQVINTTQLAQLPTNSNEQGPTSLTITSVMHNEQESATTISLESSQSI